MRLPKLTAVILSSVALGASACSDDGAESDTANLAEVSPELLEAARANLERITREIDKQHLGNYDLSGELADQFTTAVRIEYGARRELLERRFKTLASMVFFSAPEVKTDPSIGHITPFHGMDEAAFEALMANEDIVFGHHMGINGGSPNGVRPFSVCETKFMIAISTGETTNAEFVSNKLISNYDAYALAYQKFAANCEQKDLAEWYNFRGLGGLRPSWLESNISDRFLRRMTSACQSPKPEVAKQCKEWKKNRLAYRDKHNTELALRNVYYDPRPQAKIDDQTMADYLAETSNPGVLVEDRNGDGIGDWIAEGPLKLREGAAILNSLPADVDRNKPATLSIAAGSKQFVGDLRAQFPQTSGSFFEAKIPVQDIVAHDQVDPAYKPEFLSKPDLGMQKVFSDGSGCTGEAATPESCPLLRRFYTLIDRHEDFYQTYTGLNPTSSSVSQQPSPLVACSITLGAAHGWDTAGTPQGGTAGFIYLMRIPFSQILSGDQRSIDTLGLLKDANNDNTPDNSLTAGVKVLTIRDLYQGAKLEMDKVWLDIATLSSNKFSSEHEISKYGSVPAEQIEGILVIRRPAAMGGGGGGGGGDP